MKKMIGVSTVLAILGTVLTLHGVASGKGKHTFFGVQLKKLKTPQECYDTVAAANFDQYFFQNGDGIKLPEDACVIFSDYFPSQEEAKKAASLKPSAKLFEFSVTPQFQSSGGKLSVYVVRIGETEDSVFGDVWLRNETGKLMLLEKAALLRYAAPERPDVFRFVSFSKGEDSLVYCKGECLRVDARTGQKVQQINKPSAQAESKVQTHFELEEGIEVPAQIPADVLEILKQDERKQTCGEDITSNWFKASEIDLNNDQLPDLVVMAANSCLYGANIGPYWVFFKTPKGHKLVLDTYALGLDVLKSKHNGARDISATAATADKVNSVVFRFNGKNYIH